MTASRSGMAENWIWGNEAGGRKGKARSLWMKPPESQNPSHLRLHYGVFPGGQVVKNPPSNAGDAGSIPDRGTRSHMLQLGAWMPQLKIMHAITKTWLSQINKDIYIYTAAAKSLQSCDPIDGSPPGSPVPGILQARTLEWVAISFSNVWKWKVKVKSLSRVQLFETPWTAAYQAPPSMGFSRQEYWSEFHCLLQDR